MLILFFAVSSLKWITSSKSMNDYQFNKTNEEIKGLSSNLIQKNKGQCCAKYEGCEGETDMLKIKYDMFVKDCVFSSELCNYWDLILKFINLLKQLTPADKERNWNTHLCTVQEWLPLF